MDLAPDARTYPEDTRASVPRATAATPTRRAARTPTSAPGVPVDVTLCVTTWRAASDAAARQGLSEMPLTRVSVRHVRVT